MLSKNNTDFFSHFFSLPLLPALAVLCSVSTIALTSDGFGVFYESKTDYSKIISSGVQTDDDAEMLSETEEQPTTVPPEEPEPLDYTQFKGYEPANSAYYQDRLAIIGDSVAYGFNAYGFIPDKHNMAQESVAMWNLDEFTYDIDGEELSAVDAAAQSGAQLVLISIGMNDIPGSDPDKYSSDMLALAHEVLDAMPAATVITGSITPISADNPYTSNETINSFNSSLRSTVEAENDPRLLFFDTNAILTDPAAGALDESYDAGDGLHIAKDAYEDILFSLYAYLDATNVINTLSD